MVPLLVFWFVDVNLLDAVARIAYIASDVVISIQPALEIDSSFSKHLFAFANANATATTLQKQSSSSEVQPMLNISIHFDIDTHYFSLARYALSDTMQILSCPFSTRYTQGNWCQLRQILPSYCSLYHISTSLHTSCRRSSVFTVW